MVEICCSKSVLPGAVGGRVALGQHPLLGLGQRVRHVAAERDQVVAVAGDLGRVGQLGRALVGQRQPLQLEEPERGS